MASEKSDDGGAHRSSKKRRKRREQTQKNFQCGHAAALLIGNDGSAEQEISEKSKKKKVSVGGFVEPQVQEASKKQKRKHLGSKKSWAKAIVVPPDENGTCGEGNKNSRGLPERSRKSAGGSRKAVPGAGSQEKNKKLSKEQRKKYLQRKESEDKTIVLPSADNGLEAGVAIVNARRVVPKKTEGSPAVVGGSGSKKRKTRKSCNVKRHRGLEGVDLNAAGVAVSESVASAHTRKGPPKRGDPVGTNWRVLKELLYSKRSEKQTRTNARSKKWKEGEPAGSDSRSTKRFRGVDVANGLEQEILGLKKEVVAMDCEMVTVRGSNGVVKEVAARVAVVDNKGDVLMDTFAKSQHWVIDYKTRYSGVRPHNLKDAPPLDSVREAVEKLLKGKLLVGHALHNDFHALGIDHPQEDVRDTSRYHPLMCGAGGIVERVSLKHLAEAELGMVIQVGEHSPVEDARAALYLYHKHRDMWEQEASWRNIKFS